MTAEFPNLAGTLVDKQITNLAEAGRLIVGDFDPQRVRQACYELRASAIFWDVGGPGENKRQEVGPEGFILRPNTHVVAIVMERLELPSNVLARILTKGQLFSVGIQAVNTYADPGFRGRLGITLFNASKRYIIIKPGLPIAKVEFTVLPQEVDEPYSGQHGYETEIWPIPSHLYADEAQLRSEGRVSNPAAELESSFGPTIADLSRRLDFYARRVWVQLLVTLVLYGLLFFLVERWEPVLGIVSGVAANALTYLVMPRIRVEIRH